MEHPPKSTVGGIARQPEPTALGAYPLLGVIGRSSMGTVYRSMDPRTRREVAIKAVRRDDRASPNSAARGYTAPQSEGVGLASRLRLEAAIAASLSHPGIVAVHEYGEDAAHAFVVMEYVEGSSLRQCFERKLDFSPGRSIAILSQVLEALQHAHERGVWHRDVKPSNILITAHDRVKLMDFGIARTAAPAAEQLDVILGTPGYVAPESYLSDGYDARVDVFAAGAVLYHLLTGVPAFAGTADEIMFKVCHDSPLPPSMVAAESSLQRCDEVVLQALARRPDDRFSSAASFRDALLSIRPGR